MKSLILASAALAATIATANAQDLAAGEQSFRKCLPCHSIGADARNKVGPELNGPSRCLLGACDPLLTPVVVLPVHQKTRTGEPG